MPARFMAGTKNSTASIGDSFASPATRSIEELPPRRSIRPVTRNRLVWMVMWCAT